MSTGLWGKGGCLAVAVERLFQPFSRSEILRWLLCCVVSWWIFGKFANDGDLSTWWYPHGRILELMIMSKDEI